MKIVLENLNRFVYRHTRKFNVLKIRSLDSGYHDRDEILLHSMMQVLVDYVEVELSSLYLSSRAENSNLLSEKVIQKIPTSLRFDFLMRNKSRGLKMLEMWKSMGGVNSKNRDDNQALLARRIEKVYKWWTEERPKRQSPEDLSGMNNFISQLKSKKGDDVWDLYFSKKLNSREEDLLKTLSSKIEMIEMHHIQEDKNMMEQLVGLSPHLWT